MSSIADLCLILPTLNERENVTGVIRSLLNTYPTLGRILIADDDSKDGTRDAIWTAFPIEVSAGQIQILHRKKDLGLTPSLRDAVHICDLPLVGWMDCDGSMPIDVIAKLIACVGDCADIAVASRFASGGRQKSVSEIGRDSRFEVWLSNLLNGLLHRVLQLSVSDLTSGFIILKTDIAKCLRFQGRHGEYFIFLILQAKQLGIKMVEVPYVCGTRQYGKSKTFGTFQSAILNSIRYSLAFLGVLLHRGYA